MLFYYCALIVVPIFGIRVAIFLDPVLGFIIFLVESAFQLHYVPTLLYCWQYYDVIASIKIKTTTVWNKVFAWIRGLLVVTLCMSTVSFWITYAYSSEAFYYLESLTNLQNNYDKLYRADQWILRSITVLDILGFLECFLSIAFLVGIIWQCN
jgi:uncharacterized membrane protein YkgB